MHRDNIILSKLFIQGDNSTLCNKGDVSMYGEKYTLPPVAGRESPNAQNERFSMQFTPEKMPICSNLMFFSGVFKLRTFDNYVLR